MEVRIDTDSYMPVHAQLREQIKFLILNGELKPATKLPSARQLAGFLRINRNTVLKAYQALAQEGLIECRRGRGCVVVERPEAITRGVPAHLLTIIDRAIEQASELGVAPDDFASFAYTRAKQRQDVQVRRRLAFVECDATIASELVQILEEKLEMEVVPIVLRDLEQPAPEVEAILREIQVVATTFFHVQDVRRLLAKAKKEVVALGIKPHLENLIQVLGVAKGTTVALVCVSECCAQELQQSLEDAGIRGLQSVLGGTDDLPKLSATLSGLPVVIASSFVVEDVRPLLEPGQELIVLDYTTLDEGAINLLKSLMREETS